MMPSQAGGDDFRLKPHALGDLGADGGVEAHHFVLLVDEVEGRIGAAHGDAHDALFLDGGQFVGGDMAGRDEGERPGCKHGRNDLCKCVHVTPFSVPA